jgi:hypothetical protein
MNRHICGSSCRDASFCKSNSGLCLVLAFWQAPLPPPPPPAEIPAAVVSATMAVALPPVVRLLFLVHLASTHVSHNAEV